MTRPGRIDKEKKGRGREREKGKERRGGPRAWSTLFRFRPAPPPVVCDVNNLEHHEAPLYFGPPRVFRSTGISTPIPKHGTQQEIRGRRARGGGGDDRPRDFIVEQFILHSARCIEKELFIGCVRTIFFSPSPPLPVVFYRDIN